MHTSSEPNATADRTEGLASIREASEYLGLGRSTVYELMKSELKSVRVGVRRLIPRAELARFVDERLAAA